MDQAVTAKKRSTGKSAKSGPNDSKAPTSNTKAKTTSARGKGAASELSVGLFDPGMTPMLRAGLGGLAASLRAIAIADGLEAKWPESVALGSGEAAVEPTRIVLRFNDAEPEKILRDLFERSFVVRNPQGLIHLPGAFEPLVIGNTALCVALQNGLKRTFLQHGKSTGKAGGAVTKEVELDEKRVQVTYQPYASFAHQTAFEDVVEAMRKGGVQLAGWAYPGNAGRHNGFKADTDWRYTASQALASVFALVGCLSFEIPRSGGAGALIVVEPSDLVEYAMTRPMLTPKNLAEAYMSSAGDAALGVHLRLRAERVRHQPGVLAVHGVTLRATPWASQQKSRISTFSLATARDDALDLYEIVSLTLPTKILSAKAETNGDDDGASEAGFYAATSALRAFVTDNVARGARWFSGFGTATTGGKKPRFLHYYRSPDAKNLGALYPGDRKGLIAMVEYLEESEQVLVRSVHDALRRRLGLISKETKDLPLQTRKNRWNSERDKWRLAFSGSKTPEQIRAALADLWSRAGYVAELQRNWELVLPLLRPATWQIARDLSLVALASYAKTDRGENGESDILEEGEE